MTEITFKLNTYTTETCLEKLIEAGAEVTVNDNYAVISSSKNAYTEALRQLIYAAMSDNIETIKVLVDENA